MDVGPDNLIGFNGTTLAVTLVAVKSATANAHVSGSSWTTKAAKTSCATAEARYPRVPRRNFNDNDSVT